MKSLWREMAAGFAAGAAAGTMTYLLAGGCTKKTRLKVRTAKAMRALSDVIDSITDLWR